MSQASDPSLSEPLLQVNALEGGIAVEATSWFFDSTTEASGLVLTPGARRSQPLEYDWLCPSCGYNLRGLPTAHRCPECGFDYDPNAVVIALHGKRLRGADAYAMVALFGGSIVLAVTVFGGARMRSWLFDGASTGFFILKSVNGALLAVIGVYAVVRIWRRLRSKQELRINQKGVQFVDPSLPGELIPWDRIAEAEYLEDGDEFVIRGKSGEALVTCPRRIIGGRSNVELCARQVNALRDKYHDRV